MPAPTGMSPRDPRDIHTEADASTTPRERLLVFWDGGFATHTLPAAGKVTIGRLQECEIWVDHPSVSRKHAELLLGPQLRVVDLGSFNGTRVGGVRIAPNTPTVVPPRTVVEIGSTFVVVESPTQEQAAPGTMRPPPPGQAVDLVVADERMAQLHRLLRAVAQGTISVVLLGETGVGKEVMAQSIHRYSPRASRPFVTINCAAIPEALLESELFGHERGAFTGAVATRKGVFEEAHGGTLLIDEIGDLAPDLQPKLLRALERREVRRVGGNKWIEVDVRVLAATRRDLDAEVAAGRFRDDLFHRLAVARIELPPLRARRGDVRVLVERFCSEMRGDRRLLDDALLDAWDAEAWPGNVRELRNAVARRLALGEIEEEADPDDAQTIPKHGAPVHETEDDLVARVLSLGLPLVQARERLVREFEARYVAHVLAQHGGNVTRAAEASGVARRHFQRVKKRAGE
jgi:transcriptional regulator with GAF, ATPase, and Fis domain